MEAMIEWFKAAGWCGLPHWGLMLLGAYMLMEWALPKVKNVRAHSAVEAIANVAHFALAKFLPAALAILAKLGTAPDEEAPHA